MIKTYKYRLYPSTRQVAALVIHLSEACRLYNAALQERRDAYRTSGKSINFYDQDAQLKGIRSDGDLGIANFSCARDVLQRVDRAFNAFFRRVKACQTPGYPRFKSFRRYDSISFKSGCRPLPNNKLRVQGIGEIRVKLHRPVDGTIKTVTIKREADRWFVCFTTEFEAHPLPASSEAIALDLGASPIFATLSDATTVANPRCYRAAEKRLRIAQRKVSRRKKGSNRRRKAVMLLQRVHAHIRNQRADFHHKVSRSLVNRFGLIAIEDVKPAPGLTSGFTAKPIYDAGWGLFIDKLTYKAESARRVLVKVDPAGTSQTCLCGAAVPKTVAKRRHECSACGLRAPRDQVSAQLILALGLSVVGSTWPSGAGVPAEAPMRGNSHKMMRGPSSGR